MAADAPPFPRGTGGCVLYPGTKVEVHSLKGTFADLNGKEATCDHWDASVGRMYIRLLETGKLKALRPTNLRKVVEKDDMEDDPQYKHVLAIFETFDKNGDGVLDAAELSECLKALGLGPNYVTKFLQSIDKDGDNEVQYSEFVKWVFKPATTKTKKSNLDVYWPRNPKKSKSMMMADIVDGCDSDEEESHEPHDLSQAELEKQCGGELPDGWPPHGLKVVNNVRARFPDYPVEGIVWMMRRNDFVGGKVIAAIRATGAKEIETVPPSAIKIGVEGAFPAMYRVRHKPLAVYSDADKSWSFKNMRDGLLEPIGHFPAEHHFEVLEVKRGNEYGFCFGRVTYEDNASIEGTIWAVLGLEVNRTHWTAGDRSRKSMDLNYTEAARLPT